MDSAPAPAGEFPASMRMVMIFKGAAFGTHLATVTRLARPAAALLALATLACPASAQFWESRPAPSRPSGSYFQQMFGPFQSYPQGPPEYREGPRPQVDYSRAPAAKKPETTPLSTVVVLGDSMADWLAYGLEDVLSDSPEFGVSRKNRTNSGLIRYDQRADYDWARAGREILATEKPSFIVMMIGLQDRQSIRDRPAAPRPGTAPQPDQQAGATQAQKQTNPPGQPPAQAAQPQEQPAAPPAPDAESENAEPAIAAAESARPARPATGATYEFRTDKWGETYAKRIDETIAALKSKGVPVFWVGLPPIRGARSTSDMVYLNNLYRSRAEKAGIVYVDVWDGFIDERNAFTMSGPDYSGQTRRLRTEDGVHFTKAGANKLAHYVEREIQRSISRNAPIAIPSPQEQQQLQTTTMRPGIPAPRPLAGPVVPLSLTGPAREELAGGGVINTGSPDPIAARVLVKGEPLPAAVNRADDFQWPPRQPEGAEQPVTASAPATAPAPARRNASAPASNTSGERGKPAARTGQPAGQASASNQNSASGEAPRGQTKQAPPAKPATPARSGVPRPPAPIGNDRPVTGGW